MIKNNTPSSIPYTRMSKEEKDSHSWTKAYIFVGVVIIVVLACFLLYQGYKMIRPSNENLETSDTDFATNMSGDDVGVSVPESHDNDTKADHKVSDIPTGKYRVQGDMGNDAVVFTSSDDEEVKNSKLRHRNPVHVIDNKLQNNPNFNNDVELFNTNDLSALKKSTHPEQRKPEQRHPEQRKQEQRHPEQRHSEQRNPEQRPPEQRNPEQRPPEQRNPEQRPPEQRHTEQRNPEQRPPEQRHPEQRPPEQRHQETRHQEHPAPKPQTPKSTQQKNVQSNIPKTQVQNENKPTEVRYPGNIFNTDESQPIHTEAIITGSKQDIVFVGDGKGRLNTLKIPDQKNSILFGNSIKSDFTPDVFIDINPITSVFYKLDNKVKIISKVSQDKRVMPPDSPDKFKPKLYGYPWTLIPIYKDENHPIENYSAYTISTKVLSHPDILVREGSVLEANVKDAVGLMTIRSHSFYVLLIPFRINNEPMMLLSLQFFYEVEKSKSARDKENEGTPSHKITHSLKRAIATLRHAVDNVLGFDPEFKSCPLICFISINYDHSDELSLTELKKVFANETFKGGNNIKLALSSIKGQVVDVFKQPRRPTQYTLVGVVDGKAGSALTAYKSDEKGKYILGVNKIPEDDTISLESSDESHS